MRRNILYAGRMKGDIEPGLEPSRLGGDDAKAWARMDFPGMRIAGQPDQHIYEESTAQKFEIGTRRIEYGRTFRYALAGADLIRAANGRLSANGNYVPDAPSYPDTFGFYGKPTVEAVVGDTSIELDDTGVADRAADYYKGAYLVPFVLPFNCYYIVASDASTATGTVVYLDRAIIQTTIAVTIDCEVHLSPYNNIVDIGDAGVVAFTWMAAVGKAPFNITSGRYFWLQTAGPCWVQPTGWGAATTCPGYAAYKRDVYCNVDGTIVPMPTAVVTGVGDLQRVGYLLAATEAGAGSGFVMLQLE